MARDRITSSTQDLISDSGSVLLSLVKGEQKELATVLKFLTVANTDYTYEAVIVEGLNDTLGTKPTTVDPDGTSEALTVRLCTYLSTWNPTTAYNAEEVVDYGGSSYKLLSGTGRVSSITPDSDSLWELHDKRTVYIQFHKDLTTDVAYQQQPTPDVPVYGFIELRVTENGGTFPYTWKPLRGLVEFLFSPTELV